MHGRPGRRARFAIAGLLAGLLVVSAATAGAVHPSPLADVVGSPPREVSPFTSPDAFCVPDRVKPPGRRTASAPGVTARAITIAFLVPPRLPVAGTPATGAPTDPATAVRRFGDLVNRCGGILGRTVDVDTVPQTSDPRVDCGRVAAIHAFVVVAWTRFAGAPCVSEELRTVMVAPSDRASNATLRRSQGRLAVGSAVDGVLPARVLDLVESGRLDGKRVAVVATSGGDRDAQNIRDLLARADPSRKITLVAATPSPSGPPNDAVIATSFSPPLALLAHGGRRPVAVYSLGDGYDGGLEALRALAGPDVAGVVGTSGIFAWIGPDVASFRMRDLPTRFAAMCNRADAVPEGDATSSTAPTTTSTSNPTLPGGPYQQTSEVCLAWRVTARALYNSGPNPTERSLVRALYRLPFIDSAAGGPNARPQQVINEPLARAGLAVFLARAEYPCVHPAPPRSAADARPCWVPVRGWEDGHAVNAPIAVGPAGSPTR